ncbi:uncharacterized protein [Fopius arisanus]|uniref:Uncharacterized protein isoform X2 n=1 Tax=Fopius arisanus TaxID=64838 RepID=A0A0C9PH74_9HYME|nr:PREDICTED: uncharacterized protein LOC105271947 isoform X2 [Fopius arisanus]
MNNLIMDNLGHNFSSSMWFNSNLFITNGVPFKFYLDGYDLHEFTAIVKIIEAYGGKLSEPDGPDTIVFCEAGGPLSTEKYEYYDIKYFHDSIVGLQPLELMDYKLWESTNQRLENPRDESIKSFGNEENKFDPSTKIDTSLRILEFQNGLEDGENSSNDPASSTCTKKCFVKLERFEICDEEDHHSAEVQEDQYESLVEEDELSDDSGVSQTSDDSNHSQAGDDMILSNRSHSSTRQVTDRSRKRSDSAPGLRNQRRRNLIENKLSTPKNTAWTFAEQQALIQYLIDNDIMHRGNSRKTWMEYIDKCGPLNPPRTAESLRCRYRHHLAHDYAKYIDDPEVLRKFEAIEEKWHSNYNKQKGIAWTDAEDQTLIQYLIDKDAISQANTTKVWVRCLEACKPLLHPSRTATALLTRFRYKLQKTYPRFTNDPAALMKFKQLETRRTISSKNYWTDEENKMLIQFIIEKNAAYEARLYTFWKDHLAELQSTYCINRTANALRYQYYKELRYNYEKYTDDPEARRQFKEVLSRIRPNTSTTND